MHLRLAFTGTGYISRIHARAAQALPAVDLVAVVNHRPQSMADFAAEFGISRQYPTIAALLADGDVDAISVNTPNYLHATESIAALDAGLHVLVEKPMAMNAAEAEAMVAASRNSGALLMVAHCWRFDEEVLWLKKQLDDGRLGQLIRTKGYGVHVNWGPASWFSQRRYAGGGALADMGIHAIDTARFLLGDPQPTQVYAKVGTHYKAIDVDDTGIILVDWDNDVTSYFESGWWQPHADGPEAGTQIYGRFGFASLFPTRLSLINLETAAVENVDPGFAHPRAEHCPQSMYDAQMAYFVDCLRSNTPPLPGGAEGVVNMRIVDAAYESARANRAIHIPHTTLKT